MTTADLWKTNRPVEELMNIGPKMSAGLKAVGIQTEHELRKTGAVDAWKMMIAHDPARKHIMCLYALQGALLEMSCLVIPEEIKEILKKDVADFY